MKEEQNIDLLFRLPANVPRMRLCKLHDYTPLAGGGGVSTTLASKPERGFDELCQCVSKIGHILISLVRACMLAFAHATGAPLTYGRVNRFVSFLVGAHPPAVEKCVQGLLLTAPRQTAEALGAGPCVNAARLALGEGAR